MMQKLTLGVAYLGMCAALAGLALRQDGRELTNLEGRFAAALSARIDSREVHGISDAQAPGLKLLSRWAAWAGMTERPLRLSVLGLLLVGAACGLYAIRRHLLLVKAPEPVESPSPDPQMPHSRCEGELVIPIGVSVVALSPWLGQDLLHPWNLGLGAGGFLLCALAYCAGGGCLWLVPSAMGGAILGQLDLRGAPAIVLAAVLLVMLHPRRGRAMVASFSVLVAALLSAWSAHGFPGQFPIELPPTGTLESPVAGLLFLDSVGATPTLAIWAGAALGLALVRQYGRRVLGRAGLSLALVAATFALSSGWQDLSFRGQGFSLFLVPLAGLLAALTSAAPALLRIPLILALMIPLVGPDLTAPRPGSEWRPAWQASPARQFQPGLHALRAHVIPGSRVLLWGEDRFALLHYAGRGHDPAVPILLVPEEIAFDRLESELRDRLVIKPGEEDRAPPILATPPLRPLPVGLTESRIESGPMAWQLLRIATSTSPSSRPR